MIRPKTAPKKTVLIAKNALVIQCLASSLSTYMLCATRLVSGCLKLKFQFGPKKHGRTTSLESIFCLHFKLKNLLIIIGLFLSVLVENALLLQLYKRRLCCNVRNEYGKEKETNVENGKVEKAAEDK